MDRIDLIKNRLEATHPSQIGDNLSDIQFLLDEVEKRDNALNIISAAARDASNLKPVNQSILFYALDVIESYCAEVLNQHPLIELDESTLLGLEMNRVLSDKSLSNEEAGRRIGTISKKRADLLAKRTLSEVRTGAES